MKFKHVNLTEFDVKYADTGIATIEGYGSTFGNKDDQGDIVMPGAFIDSLKDRMPAMLYQHKTEKIAGIWDAASEDSKGLIMQGKTLNTTLGRDVAEEMRSGALKCLSIGYGVKSNGAIYDRANNTRILKALDLYEVSPVTFPANDKATITNVKAALESIDTAADLIEQAGLICQSFLDGNNPSPEMLASMMQMMTAAMNLLEEPDSGEEPDDGSKSKLSPKQIERILREAGMSRGDARGVLAKGYTAIVAPREAEGQGLTTLMNIINNMKA
jgi:HK97 family phage prohead protease